MRATIEAMQMRTLLALVLMILAAPIGCASADAVKANDIYVIDGDTIEALGKRIRLVGFDAPELGAHARCGLERMLAARATSRLRQMIKLSDDIDLQIVECSCRPGTEGTMACNYGRACGYLAVDGQDVGDVLIAENLAHPLVCGKYSCPRRPGCRPRADCGKLGSSTGVREALLSAAAILVPAGASAGRFMTVYGRELRF
jgi:endonuclease YncB( thermonuclease family)